MTSKTERFEVDLFEDEENRWDPVIAATRKRAARLMKRVWSEVEEKYSDYPMDILAWVVDKASRIIGGAYRDEMEAWASGIGVPMSRVVALNLSYELTNIVSGGLSLPGLGCTSVITRSPKLGTVHARTLDWDLEAIRGEAIIVDFEGPSGPFSAVTWPGYVGVLSGVAAGRFAITLNQAPHAGGLHPTWWPPSVLVRRAFEECDDFDKAVEFLCEAPFLTSAFLAVSGPGARQAVVLECLPDEYAVRRKGSTALVATNHFCAPELREYNDLISDEVEEGFYGHLEYSKMRARAGASLAAKREIVRLSDGFGLLAGEPITWEQTLQRMVLHPESGELLLRQ